MISSSTRPTRSWRDAGLYGVLALLAAGASPGAGVHAQTFGTLWNFGTGNDGQSPSAALFEKGGKLFTTTPLGGASGSGTVVSVDPSNKTERVLHSFSGKEGANSTSTLIEVSGTLYGTCETGGSKNDGTVFALDEKTGRETTVHDFAGGNDGASPVDGLIYQNGVLYGTTFINDAKGDGYGTVFSIGIATGTLTTLHVFGAGADGRHPSALVVQGGLLYGTTEVGGQNGSGTVFVVDPATSAESVVYSFKNTTDGAAPQARLISVNNALYGTTSAGGTYFAGTAFRVDAARKIERTIWDFGNGADGQGSVSPLVYHGGHLYGTTPFGGASSQGTVFDIDVAGGTERVLHNFTGNDGEYPNAGLLFHRKTLYGTNFSGGTSGAGTVFGITLP